MDFGVIGLRAVFSGPWTGLVDWNLCVKFGRDPEYLSVMRTCSAKFEGLKHKTKIFIGDSWV